MIPESTRRVIGRAVAACTAALSLLAPAGATAAGPDLFDEVYARAQAQESKLRTMHARFTETTESTLLRNPVVARGTLVAEWPTRIRLEYDTPERRIVVVDDRRLVMVTPGRHERFDRDITSAQARVRKYFVDKTPAELRRQFAITATGGARPSDAYRIVMVPKRKQIRQGLSELRLWIDARTLILRRMQMIFPDGDSRTFTLEDVRTNEPIAAGTFDAPQ
jgi:outer membrane lipoprotein-sorting protein